MLPLPVDAHVERACSLLHDHLALVLTAAPGAGKTTRMPPALIDRGRVLLLQPRRVAARPMARRIAAERGWTIGREIGWHIRFERQFTADTRLLVVTEGKERNAQEYEALLHEAGFTRFQARSTGRPLDAMLAIK